MGRLTDLKSILCQKKSQKGPPTQNGTYPFWALWHHILQRCHDGLQPRRKKEGSGEGFGERCANRVPSGPVRQVKSLIFYGGYSKITLLAFFPGSEKASQKAPILEAFGLQNPHYTLQGTFGTFSDSRLRRLFFRTIFQLSGDTRSWLDPAECADPGSLFPRHSGWSGLERKEIHYACGRPSAWRGGF